MFGNNFRSYLISLCSLIVLVTYQNCGEVAFKRVDTKPGGFGGIAECSFNSWQVDIAPTTVHKNEAVAFSITSDPAPVRITWDLGDGTTSTNASGTHAYTNVGVMNGEVNIWKTEDCIPQRATFTITVIEDTVVCPPVADLAISGPSSGSVGENLSFIVNSPNCMNTNVTWTFGDGEPVAGTAINANPTSHAWSHPGIFVVTAHVTDTISGTSIDLSHLVDIQGTCPDRNDLFISGPDVGFVNEDLSFFVNIPGCWRVTNMTWHQGTTPDMTATVNPASFAYPAPGVYTVSVFLELIVGGTGPATQLAYLTHQVTILPINDICPSIDQLELSGPTVGDVREDLKFHLHIPDCFNLSTAAWDWKDGSPNDVGIDTIHAFDKPGDYDIAVTVRPVTGATITIIRRVHIRGSLTTPTPTPTATATATPTPTPTPNPCPTCAWIIVWGPCTGACGINQGTQNPSYQCIDAGGAVHPGNQCPMVMPTPPPPRACTVQLCGYRFTYVLGPCTGGVCSPNSSTAVGATQSVISYQCQGQDQNGVWTNLPEAECTSHGVNPDLSARPCARPCLSCSGGTHGQRISWFDVASVACNQSCPAAHVSTCNDGTWSPQAPGAIRSCSVTPPAQQTRFVPAQRQDISMTMGQLSTICRDAVYPTNEMSYQHIYTTNGAETVKARFIATCAKRACVAQFGGHAAGVLKTLIPATYLPNTQATIRCEKPVTPQNAVCVNYTDVHSIEYIGRAIPDVTSQCADLGPVIWKTDYLKACGTRVCQNAASSPYPYTSGYLVETASSIGISCFRETPVFTDMWGTTSSH